jgi:hypothetical protein
MPLPVFKWSLSANYPAGANLWNTNPVALQPPGTWFTPDVPIDAEEINWCLGSLAADAAALTSWAGSGPALNWYPEFLTYSGSGGFGALQMEYGAWDQLSAKWFAVTVTPSGTPLFQMWVSHGLDQGGTTDWIQLGTNTLTSTDLVYVAACADPTTVGQYWLTGVDNSGPPSTYRTWNYNGTWTVSESLTASGTSTYQGVALCTHKGNVIVAVAQNGVAVSRITFWNGAVWAHYNPGLNMAVGSTWYVQSNGAVCVAVPSSTNVFTTFYSTDGVTWSSSASLAGLISLGTIVGLAWTADAVGSCWLVCVSVVGLPHPLWFRSSDGINWTAQTGGVTSSTYKVTDMAACGSLLVCTTADQTSGGPSGQIWSPDGGVTWYPSQACFTSNSVGSTVGYSRPRVSSSGIGFMAYNSLYARFSTLAGVPATKL